MTQLAMSPTRRRGSGRHPAGLLTLASTELWERFSFYGLQVLLAYYVYYSAADGGLGLSEADALAIAGAYGGAVYVSQPVGAWVADRLVPARTLVVVGGGLIMSGHIVLALVPGVAGLLAGLVLIVFGTGALFPNVLAMMNLLYADDSPRRDAGYTLYYTCILVGALIGPMVTGFLQVRFGFHVAFSAAALGILIGLLGYVLRRGTLPDAARTVPNPASPRTAVSAGLAGAGVVLAVVALAALGVITVANFNILLLTVILVIAALYFVVLLRSERVDAQERVRVSAFIPLFVVGTAFWTLVLQLFTTFAIYADTRVDLGLGPITVPAAYISTFQVVTAIVAGPLIALAGQRLALRRPDRAPSTATKLGLGFLVMTATFLLFTLFAVLFDGPVPLAAVVLGMILLGVTEVSIAPIFLSSAGQLAPRAFNAQMMALAGLSLAAGASLSGFSGQLFVAMAETPFFLLLSAIALVCAGVLFGARGFLSRAGLH